MKAPVSGGGTRQIAPAGTHIARCYQVIDHGTHYDEKWAKHSRKVQFIFELPNEKAVFNEEKGEQPFYVKSTFTLSMNEKATLRKFVQSWIGKEMNDKEAAEFDLLKLCGRDCMVNVVHTTKGDNTYVNIASISPLMKGATCPPAFNKLLTYDTTEHNQEVFDQLPEFLQKIIQDSDEWKARVSKPSAAPSFASEHKQHASIVDGPAHEFEQQAPDDLFASRNDNPFKD